MTNNSIAILLPVYNGGNYLKESVQSVLAQAYTQFELIIVDDCSSDGSREWLRTLKDERIKYFENPVNQGLFKNLNQMVSKTNATLIKLWAQDDIMYPNCIAETVAFHNRNPSIGFSYTGRDIIDENGTIKPNDKIDSTPEIISTELHARIAYYTGSIAGNIANTCISKAALDKVGPFNESMKISADFDMWVRLAEFFDTGFISKKLIQLRDHSGQLSRNEKYYINHVREDLQVYKYLDGYVSNESKKSGKKLLRKTKLSFYTTLMVKTFFKGNFSNAKQFWGALNSYDNPILIFIEFIKVKLFKIQIATPLKKSND